MITTGTYGPLFAAVHVVDGQVHTVGVYGEEEKEAAIEFAEWMHAKAIEQQLASDTVVYQSETEGQDDGIIWRNGQEIELVVEEEEQ